MRPTADPGFNAALLVALGELRKADRLEAEIEHTLAGRGYDLDTVAGVVERLKSWRFLDDRRTVDDRVSYGRQRKLGRARIAVELVEKGAPQEEVAQRLSEISDESEIELAVELLAKKPRAKPPQAARFLAYRGFDEETIEAVLARVYPDMEAMG